MKLPLTSPALNFREARLRASPAYELVLLDRLSAAEQQVFSSLAGDPECYGVLRPREESALSAKAISRDTALLLFSLQSAGPLPRYVAARLDDECVAVVGKMILDGILEIEINGEMISGPAASALLWDHSSVPTDEGTLARLSRRAIEYGAALELTDPLALSARLYFYNCKAASRRWRDLWPDTVDTAKYLGLAAGMIGRGTAEQWTPLPESQFWLSWRSQPEPGRAMDDAQPFVAYKLYVSPACEQLREAADAVGDALAGSRAVQWKVGKGLHGLLRPDKMVIYFRQFTDLQEAALRLMTGLEGCRAHGVPFTAELAGGGLLSWAVDPPVEAGSVPWLDGESWRGRICNRLALALIQAGKEAGGSVCSSDFAVERMRLEGIDTNSWAPYPGPAWGDAPWA